MALLFLDSFDHYQTADMTKKWTDSWGSYAIVPSVGRCGTQALKIDSFANIDRGLLFSGATCIVGFAFNYQSQYSAGNGLNFCMFQNASGATYATLGTSDDGSIFWVTDGNTTYGSSSVPNLVHMDTWYFIEWKYTIGDAATGRSVIRLNNVVVVDYSGNTLPGAPYNPQAPARILQMRGISNEVYLCDDLYCLDGSGAAPWNDFLGDLHVEYLRPRAAGSQQQWETLVGASTHWLAVDDNVTPDGDTSYIGSNTTGATDTQLYRPTGFTAGPLYGAQLNLYAAKSDLGPKIIAPVANGVVGPAAVAPSFGAYQYFTFPYATNPATGLAWTVAEINSAEFGAKVVI
jgi:hypothetical protein